MRARYPSNEVGSSCSACSGSLTPADNLQIWSWLAMPSSSVGLTAVVKFGLIMKLGETDDRLLIVQIETTLRLMRLEGLCLVLSTSFLVGLTVSTKA